jgi:CBS domain-containing protein
MQPQSAADIQPILTSRVLRRDGAYSVALRVFCPRTGGTVPVSNCTVCADEIAVGATPTGGFVRCGPLARETSVLEGAPPPVAARVRTVVPGVEDDVPLGAIAALGADRDGPLLVVASDGAYLGMVTPSSVRLRALGRWRDPLDTPSVREVMSDTPGVLESASVSGVLRRMATSRLRLVPVVNARGAPIGIITDLEALRWFTEAHAHEQR